MRTFSKASTAATALERQTQLNDNKLNTQCIFLVEQSGVWLTVGLADGHDTEAPLASERHNSHTAASPCCLSLSLAVPPSSPPSPKIYGHIQLPSLCDCQRAEFA